uniref:SLV.1 n=1 Tax=Streptomyces lavendulae TaxID=1914 RepID=Q6RGS0_STRLA|nr:SLV.1 [Streptomyces lavendulae]
MYGAKPSERGPGPKPGHVYVELVGGPLDGMLLDVTGWDSQEVVDGAMLMSEHGAFGPGRSDYEPAEADPGAGGVGRFVWRGDVP